MRKIAPMPKMLCKHFLARSLEWEFTALRQIRFNKVASKIRTPLYLEPFVRQRPANFLSLPCQPKLQTGPNLKPLTLLESGFHRFKTNKVIPLKIPLLVRVRCLKLYEIRVAKPEEWSSEPNIKSLMRRCTIVNYAQNC
jgi:hypothetical protein